MQRRMNNKCHKMMAMSLIVSALTVVMVLLANYDEARYQIERANNIVRQWSCPPGGYAAGPGTNGNCLCLECPVGHKCAGGNSPKRLCPRGKYQSRKGQNVCLKSPAGHYVPGRGASKPTKCQYGHYTAKLGQRQCTKASRGYKVSSRGAKKQKPCGRGTYQNHRGQKECKKSPPGTYVDTRGATKPTPCNYGTFTTKSGRSQCRLATPGHCVPGRGSSSQTPCKKNHFQNCLGQPACIPCQVGYVTLGTGAISCRGKPKRRRRSLLATPSNLAIMSRLQCRSYKYMYVQVGDGRRRYLSPSTKALWNWNKGVQVVGDYKHTTNGGKLWKSYKCTGSQEKPLFGVGCSMKAGQAWKTLPYAHKNPRMARAWICQDFPRTFPQVCQWAVIHVIGDSCL